MRHSNMHDPNELRLGLFQSGIERINRELNHDGSLKALMILNHLWFRWDLHIRINKVKNDPLSSWEDVIHYETYSGTPPMEDVLRDVKNAAMEILTRPD